MLIDLAVRLPAYSGVVAARMRADTTDDGSVPTYDGGPGTGVREVEATQAAILVDPVLGSLIEWG